MRLSGCSHGLKAEIHVEGRTPGPAGIAPMVSLKEGIPEPVGYEGSHHVAVYLAAIGAMVDAASRGVDHLIMTSPSEHLVKQVNGDWRPDKMSDLFQVVDILRKQFKKVEAAIAPRT